MLEDTGRLPSADLGGADENANPLADDASADRARGTLAVQFSTSRRRGAERDGSLTAERAVELAEKRMEAETAQMIGAAHATIMRAAAQLGAVLSAEPRTGDDAKQRESDADTVSPSDADDIDIDANTVPSVLQPEQRRIADLLEGDGAPSWVLRVLQGICAAACIGVAAYVWSLAAMLGMAQAEPNALLILACWFSAAPAYMMLSIPLSAVRGGIGPGGALEALGVGTAQVSTKDDKQLRRVRLVLGLVSGYMVVFSLVVFFMAAAWPDIGHTGHNVAVRLVFSALGLMFFLVIPTTVTGFLAPMYTGSCLCRNAITKQIHTVRFGDLVNDASKREEVLALQDTLELLSEGWGRGLLGLIGFCWGIALACLFNSLNGPLLVGLDGLVGIDGFNRFFQVALFVSFCFLPVLLALDVATTSSYCDILMDEINQARQRLGPEANEVITWLESSLKNLVRLLPTIFLLFEFW